MNDDGRIIRRPPKVLVMITNLNAIVLLTDGLNILCAQDMWDDFIH